MVDMDRITVSVVNQQPFARTKISNKMLPFIYGENEELYSFFLVLVSVSLYTVNVSN